MLSISNLTKTYKGGKTAVSHLSLQVESGDIFGFIGHNGAGKTTTIKAVVGIVDFEEGDILIDGISVKADPIKCKSKIAYIPDNPDLYEYMTGIQYLNFMADVFSVSKGERERLVKTYSEGFELTSALGDLISSYSHGMKQKLAIIGALIHSPRIMILDEPFVGLDPKAMVYLKEVMRELCSAGTAIFFSTHVLDVAEKLCNKVAIIKEGKLIASGKTDELTGSRSLESVFMEVVANANANQAAD
ncbi:MAG: ABC transporter ATP-binding protein [Clostridiales bacterium]|nr:ABC transporter ATP-binding protein [Clostridiales bacterium]